MNNEQTRGRKEEMKATNDKLADHHDVAESKRREWEQQQKEKREHQ